MIKNKDIIGYKKSNTLRQVVLEDVLKMFSVKANVELVKLPSRKKIDKFAVSSTIDLESNEVIDGIINGNLKKFKNLKPIDKNLIKPLYLFLDKEVLLYAKLRRLKFKQNKKTKNEIEKFLDELEKKHPEVKRAIVNSFLKLYD